jgi:hypothetical protein
MLPITTIIIASVLANSSIIYTSCSDNGGDLPDCIRRANDFPPGHRIPPGAYSSGGTFILKDAGCVSRYTVFRFHSAFYGDDAEHVRRLANNQPQIDMLEQYPRLVNYLLESGAFDKALPMTELTGEQVHELTGLPICEDL